MNPITNDTALEFIRLLVNIGGIDMLKEPEMIILDPEGQPRCVKEGDTTKPIQIIMNGMVKDENNFLFNPFKSVEGNNPAYIWFYTSRCSNVAFITKLIMQKLIQLAVEKETKTYEHLQLITDIAEACDSQMETELMKINAADILRVFYNKKIKTAEGQTMLFSDEIETQYKLRKKSWTTLRKIFSTIFELEEGEVTMSGYMYRATVLHIPEIDAKLHVIGKLIEKLAKWSELIDVKFEPEKFNEHLKNLEQYSRMFAWFTARSVKDQTIISNQTRAEGLPTLPASAVSDTTIKLNGTLPTNLPAPTIAASAPAVPVAAPMTIPMMAPAPWSMPMQPSPFMPSPMAPPMPIMPTQPQCYAPVQPMGVPMTPMAMAPTYTVPSAPLSFEPDHIKCC